MLVRPISDAHAREADEQLAEQLELLEPAQQARLQGGNALLRLLRFCFWIALLFALPLMGFVFAILMAVVSGAGEPVAVAIGVVVLGLLVFGAFFAGQRLELAGAAAELARKRRAVARLHQAEVSAVTHSSSVAVPVRSSTPQHNR